MNEGKENIDNTNDYNLEFDYEELAQKFILREKSAANQLTGLALWNCSQVLAVFLVDNQDYEKAAQLRDQQDELKKEIQAMKENCIVIL